jgi:CheY-like chemotaxis protein
MANLLLIHWHEGEAEESAERLKAAGHRVSVHWRQQGEGLRELLARPLDGIVIDLGRLPSHGRAIATYLRQTKASRTLPIVFVEGDPQKTERVRSMLPDAQFTSWRGIRGAIGRALRPRTAAPIVPRSTSGYSGTPLAKKLGVKAGSKLVLIDAPRDFEHVLGELPEGVELRRGARGSAPIALLFAGTRGALGKRFTAAERAVDEGGKLWIAWPKRTSPLARDLSEDGVRALALGRGWVDYKVCAVDADWSGLCFARRRS